MKKSFLAACVTVFCLALSLGVCSAEPTRVTVHVLSKGAKFVGTSMGGVSVVVREERTGRVLAEGKTAGDTGNTALIMNTPRNTGPISDGQSAGFTAVVNIEEPTYVEISAYGPLAQRQSANSVSITQWLLPGKDIVEGDAILLELPGFVVDILSPPAHANPGPAPQSIPIRANITMMCGCPITPGGLWDADKYEIKALIKKDGRPAGVRDLQYAGEPSQFATQYEATEPGVYEVTVYAFDKTNGNTGLDATTFSVR